MKKILIKTKDKIKEKVYLLKKNTFPKIFLRKLSGSFSQYNQDLFVIEYFQHKKNGFFLDIGAYDGICNSNTYLLETKYKWSGIAVEANPNVFPKLKINRKCQCIQACIASARKEMMLRLFPGWCEQMSGCIGVGGAEHDNRVAQESKYFKNKSTVIKVASILLEDIIQATQSKRIDYLSIDIEGNEIQIISDVLKKYPNLIELFSLECNYSRPLKTFEGYKNIYQAGVDYFFAKK